MSRRALIRSLMLGALVTSVAPLTGAGARVDVAAAAPSPAALCQSTFGDGGPSGGPVVGEGPSGDPMSTTIGWDPVDWPDGLREIVTCVSVGGRAVPALTNSMPTPRNDGSLVVSLTLPVGHPGSLACEGSVLVGAGDANGRHRTTSPVCFKLRAPEPPLGPAPGQPAPPRPVSPPPSAPKAPVNTAPLVPYPASTPPARAAFEAARGGIGMAAGRDAVPDPRLSVGVPPPVWPEPSASPASPAKATARPAAAATAKTAGAPTGAASTSLARTGIEHHIPLAGAGGFLALGGAAIIFGAPRGRRSARHSA